jgi:hypothetical protein
VGNAALPAASSLDLFPDLNHQRRGSGAGESTVSRAWPELASWSSCGRLERRLDK